MFYPERGSGLVLLVGLALALAGVGGYGLWRAAGAQAGLAFFVYLFPAFITMGLTPLLVYRAYSLWSASYVLQRDGIKLHWGLRSIDIPMNAVIWIKGQSELGNSFPMPWLPFPGAVLGTRQMKDGGVIEYLAARPFHMLFIATADRIYGISPKSNQAFLAAYHDFTELGSITPLLARSIYPNVLFARIWDDRWGRWLIMPGGIFVLLLFVMVGLALPMRSQVALRLSGTGLAQEYMPTIRLLLLPVLNAFFFVADLVLGIFFYRQAETQPLTYLCWFASIFTSLLFAGAMIAILIFS